MILTIAQVLIDKNHRVLLMSWDDIDNCSGLHRQESYSVINWLRWYWQSLRSSLTRMIQCYNIWLSSLISCLFFACLVEAFFGYHDHQNIFESRVAGFCSQARKSVSSVSQVRCSSGACLIPVPMGKSQNKVLIKNKTKLNTLAIISELKVN